MSAIKQSRENLILAASVIRVNSNSSTSIFIEFLACPCVVELTTSSVSLSPPLEPGGVRYSSMPMVASLLSAPHAGTSVNLEVAKYSRNKVAKKSGKIH